MRPVAPLLFFETLVDTALGDVELPAQTPVLVLSRPPAVDAKHFDAPATFRTERWLDGAPRTGAHDPAAHIPFGSGPRICPGRTLALLEMKMVLALLYRSFDVTRVGASADVRESFSFTMAPEGLMVRLRPRG
jgi:cytochrome P450